MNYEMEELLPLVAELSEKYTGFESTSITYEEASQLMEAVLYCIQEPDAGHEGIVTVSQKLPARQAYELGFEAVIRKVKLALDKYNQMLPSFCCYKCRCLHDTFINGIPEFFKRYDARFCPQDTILTLDYPVVSLAPELCGIDRIYAYINCIYLEQAFLGQFSEKSVSDILYRYHRQYTDLVENICEIVFMDVVAHLLAQKSLQDMEFRNEDYQKIQNVFLSKEQHQIREQALLAVNSFIQKYMTPSTQPDILGQELLLYLSASLDNILTRLNIAAKSDSLNHLL